MLGAEGVASPCNLPHSVAEEVSRGAVLFGGGLGNRNGDRLLTTVAEERWALTKRITKDREIEIVSSEEA